VLTVWSKCLTLYISKVFFFNAAYFYVSDNSQIFPLDIDIDWSLQIESVFVFYVVEAIFLNVI